MVLYPTVAGVALLEVVPLPAQLQAASQFGFRAAWQPLALTLLGKTEQALPGSVQMHGQQAWASISAGNSTHSRVP